MHDSGSDDVTPGLQVWMDFWRCCGASCTASITVTGTWFWFVLSASDDVPKSPKSAWPGLFQYHVALFIPLLTIETLLQSHLAVVSAKVMHALFLAHEAKQRRRHADIGSGAEHVPVATQELPDKQ